MEDTIQDTLIDHEKAIKQLDEQVLQLNIQLIRLSEGIHRLNRERITPVLEASAQAREVLG